MKKLYFFAPMLFCVVLIALLLQNRSDCPFCNRDVYDKPCLINLSTGGIGELDPCLHTPLGDTYETASFTTVLDLTALRTTGKVNNLIIPLPALPASPQGAALCRSCQRVLSSVSCGDYALADLSVPDLPRLLLLKDGCSFTACGYFITVKAQPDSGYLLTVSDTQPPDEESPG